MEKQNKKHKKTKTFYTSIRPTISILLEKSESKITYFELVLIHNSYTVNAGKKFSFQKKITH